MYVYIKPELIFIVPILILFGVIIKLTHAVEHKYIPIILCIESIIICAVYIILTIPARFVFSIDLIYMSIVQGIICASISTYAHQLYKQLKRRR